MIESAEPKTEQERYGIEALALFAKGLERVNSDIFWEATRLAQVGMPDANKWLGAAMQRLSLMQLDSPIEAIFALFWMVHQRERPEVVDLMTCYPHHSLRVDGQLLRPDFLVMPDIYPYDDLTIRAFDIAIVVELDGHEFHERTKQQVAARNRKDRLVQSLGWSICHFSGSEIVGGPHECVEHVIEMASRRGQLAVGEEAAGRRGVDAAVSAE